MNTDNSVTASPMLRSAWDESVIRLFINNAVDKPDS